MIKFLSDCCIEKSQYGLFQKKIQKGEKFRTWNFQGLTEETTFENSKSSVNGIFKNKKFRQVFSKKYLCHPQPSLCLDFIVPYLIYECTRITEVTY